MRIDIMTLFPGMIEGFLSESIIKRAIAANLVEINVINFRDFSPLNNKQVDEAIEVVSKYLDDAVISGLSRVLIIHGKGTGALRKGIQEYLKNHRNVLSYTLGDMDEGGSGVTAVKLK